MGSVPSVSLILGVKTGYFDQYTPAIYIYMYIFFQTPSLEGPMNLRCFFTPKRISIKKPWVGVRLLQPKKIDMLWFDIHKPNFQKKTYQGCGIQKPKTTKLGPWPFRTWGCFIRACWWWRFWVAMGIWTLKIYKKKHPTDVLTVSFPPQKKTGLKKKTPIKTHTNPWDWYIYTYIMFGWWTYGFHVRIYIYTVHPMGMHRLGAIGTWPTFFSPPRSGR